MRKIRRAVMVAEMTKPRTIEEEKWTREEDEGGSVGLRLLSSPAVKSKLWECSILDVRRSDGHTKISAA